MGLQLDVSAIVINLHSVKWVVRPHQCSKTSRTPASAPHPSLLQPHAASVGSSTGREEQWDWDSCTVTSVVVSSIIPPPAFTAFSFLFCFTHWEIVNITVVLDYIWRTAWASTRRFCCYWWRPWRSQPRWVSNDTAERGSGWGGRKSVSRSLAPLVPSGGPAAGSVGLRADTKNKQINKQTDNFDF